MTTTAFPMSPNVLAAARRTAMTVRKTGQTLLVQEPATMMKVDSDDIGGAMMEIHKKTKTKTFSDGELTRSKSTETL